MKRSGSQARATGLPHKIPRIEASSTLTDSESDSDQMSPTPVYASFIRNDFKEDESYSAFAREQLAKMAGHKSDKAEKEKSQKGTSDDVQYSSFAQKQMESMGFKAGEGLGRFHQGRADIIEAAQQRGRRGLGFKVEGFDEKDFDWYEEEEVPIHEPTIPIPPCQAAPPQREDMEDWIRIGKRKMTIEDETEFCGEEVLSEMLKSKSIFDSLGSEEFLKARTRANPYEFIRGVIFQNRAAMKMANMDAAFDFMFTEPKDKNGADLIGPNHLLYFADVCAGPGGFSEYVLWKKKWQAKGFGFTLRGDHDFKLEDFLAGSPETFEPHYGEDGDGDVFKENNLLAFKRFVMDSTDNQGVHFVMADGGFSVEGEENIQEILSKQLYLCQFLCAVSILRTGGHFVCKTFDLFTPFSVGLLYLLYRAFDEVYVFKPVTSRPANSERYVVCKGLREATQDIHDHMFNANVRINRLKSTDEDVNEIVPLEVIRSDEAFVSYITESNISLGLKQANSLKKIRAYVQDTTLVGRFDQTDIRKRCLEAWKVPEVARAAPRIQDADSKFDELWTGRGQDAGQDDTCFAREATPLTAKNLQNLKCVYDYKCVVSGGERCFLLSLGKSNIYKWDGKQNYRSSSKWSKVDDFLLELPKETLIEVEIVNELRGEGKGQRRTTAVHVLDAVVVGGRDVRNQHYQDRMQIMRLMVKAVSKPTRPELVPIRLKTVFRLEMVKNIFVRLEHRVVKGGRREPRECFMLDEGRHFVPRGIYLIKHVLEPWTQACSRSAKRLYFYNKDTKESTFECSRAAISPFRSSLSTRYFWNWEEVEETGARLERAELIQFVHRFLSGGK